MAVWGFGSDTSDPGRGRGRSRDVQAGPALGATLVYVSHWTPSPPHPAVHVRLTSHLG